jgi:uncharacterized protein (TIGR02270 family)
MSSSTPTFTVDILEELLRELAFLWGQRESALRDPDYTIRELGYLEQRISDHLDGILDVGGVALPVLEETLAGDDPRAVFAAAYALLHMRNETATRRVRDSFEHAEGEVLGALRDALAQAPLNPGVAPYRELFHGGPAPVGAAAGTVLAFHSALEPTIPQIHRLLQHEDPSVRITGWRLVSYLGVSLEAKVYAAAMRDEDPGVRRAALYAGAWSGQPGVLLVCRKLAAEPTLENLDALELLAILGTPEDARSIAALATNAALGPQRFRLLGTYGHPALMDLVLTALVEPDPAIAAAAGGAFTKMTGQNIDSDKKAKLPPENGGEPDEFEAEFSEEVTLPDPEIAHRHWKLVKPVFQQACRLRRGFDVGGALTPEVFGALDMESRWEILLRARFQGKWSGSPLRLEAFPQGRST